MMPQVRLELDKKLAASSQKFADAARLSSELKALAAKIETERASHAALLAQVESERAAEVSEAGRQGDLEGEIRAEQRELDESKFGLLLEQQVAITKLLPNADATHAELLRWRHACTPAHCLCARTPHARRVVRVALAHARVHADARRGMVLGAMTVTLTPRQV